MEENSVERHNNALILRRILEKDEARTAADEEMADVELELSEYEQLNENCSDKLEYLKEEEEEHASEDP